MSCLADVIYVLLAVSIVWFAYNQFRPTKNLRTLQSDDFRGEMKSNSMLIDVREPSEYKSGYIPGAASIPLSQLNRRLEEIPRTAICCYTAKVVCAARTLPVFFLKMGTHKWRIYEEALVHGTVN